MFDPRFPPSYNSLNGLVLAELPSQFPRDFIGTSGYAILSSFALLNAIREKSDALKVDSSRSDYDSILAFYQQAELGNLAAQDIIESMGQALAAILWTLHHASEKIRAANPSKAASYWDYWGTIRHVHLGGGLCSGSVGKVIATIAESFLQPTIPDYHISAAKYPRYLPLLGASRYVDEGNSALIFDFGGTLVKRAIAHYADDGLYRLQVLESISFGNSQQNFENFLAILVQSYQPVDSTLLPISIASYVDEGGKPLSQSGIYSQIASLSADLPAYISENLRRQLGQRLEVKLLHDGSAAASFYAPQENAAVVMLGTAIGSGFPVLRPNLRPVSSKIILETPSY